MLLGPIKPNRSTCRFLLRGLQGAAAAISPAAADELIKWAEVRFTTGLSGARRFAAVLLGCRQSGAKPAHFTRRRARSGTGIAVPPRCSVSRPDSSL